MPRRFPSGWAPFLAAAMVTLGAVPARAQDDDLPPLDDYAGAPEDVPPPQTEPPAQPPDQRTFEQSLSPYGHWVDTPEYGRVWTPDEGADWQPYTDGQWIDTDYGWTFASTVPWGWAVFHYGRWGFGPELGWFWVPGFTWAPAWVGWRSYPGFACWSPLAPRGFVFHGRWPGWVVVDRQHFTHPISRFALPRHQARPIAHAASPVRGFASTRAGRGVGSARGGAAPRSGASYQGGFRSGGGRGFQPWTHPNSGFRAGSGSNVGGFRGSRGSTFRGGGGFRGSGGFGGSAFRGGGGFQGSGGSAFRSGGSFRGGGGNGGSSFRSGGGFHASGRR
jgi:hypothetical protein